jgi:hypothetical protein
MDLSMLTIQSNMEENKTKIFWKPIGGEEFKELEHIRKVEGFDFEQLDYISSAGLRILLST